MKRLWSALLVLAAAGCGGVDVQGIVRDERTGEPLPGATVRIGDEETSTDYRGFYELRVPEDRQQLQVEKEGYEPYTEDVRFQGIDQAIQDVDLSPHGQQMHHDPMMQEPGMQEPGLQQQEGIQRQDELFQEGQQQRDGLQRQPGQNGQQQQGGARVPPGGQQQPSGAQQQPGGVQQQGGNLQQGGGGQR
ncbi:MAG: carboxypeptidase-like regulatory domain-containing protein [Planctomycetes bacterium]|nr:carboxypeptidase-like regulatory domain-containing protein [Planctomycetota bacterium]